jgi:hypothetical protein
MGKYPPGSDYSREVLEGQKFSEGEIIREINF